MVMCIVVGCASKSDTAKGVGMFRIPSVIYNQGEETEELTRMRREKWISAISRDDVKYKDILKSESVQHKSDLPHTHTTDIPLPSPHSCV